MAVARPRESRCSTAAARSPQPRMARSSVLPAFATTKRGAAAQRTEGRFPACHSRRGPASHQAARGRAKGPTAKRARNGRIALRARSALAAAVASSAVGAIGRAAGLPTSTVCARFRSSFRTTRSSRAALTSATRSINAIPSCPARVHRSNRTPRARSPIRRAPPLVCPRVPEKSPSLVPAKAASLASTEGAVGSVARCRVAASRPARPSRAFACTSTAILPESANARPFDPGDRLG